MVLTNRTRSPPYSKCLPILANVDREAARRSRDLEANTPDDHLQEQRWRQRRKRLQRTRGDQGPTSLLRGPHLAHGGERVNRVIRANISRGDYEGSFRLVHW